MFQLSDLTQGKARRYRWIVVGIVAVWVLVDARLGSSLLGLADLPYAGRVALFAMLATASLWFGLVRPWRRRAQARREAARAGRCEKCGYILRDLPSQTAPVNGLLVERPTCPECGHRQL